MTYYPRPIEFGAEYSLYSPETGATAVFNNPFHPSYAGMLTEVTGLDGPEVRESAEDLVESDGGVHGRFYFGRRPIVLSGRIFGHVTSAERAYRSDLIRRASQCLRQDGQFSWVPSKRVDNTVFNPRIANALTGYSYSTTAGSTASQARVTGQAAPSGTSTAAELTFNAAASAVTTSMYPAGGVTTITMPDGSSLRPPGAQVVAQSQSVAVSAAVQIGSISAGGSPTIRLYVRAYDDAGTYLGNVQAATAVVAVGGYVVLSGTLPVSSLPAGATFVTLQCTVVAAAAATYVVRFTNLMIGVRWDTQVPAYTDGSKAGGYWHTVPENGPSADYIPMGVGVRLQQPYRETGAWVKDFQVPLVSKDPYILSPYARTTTINLGASGPVNNQGSALYWPTLLVYSEWNSGAHIDGNGGSLKFGADAAIGVSPGQLVGAIDTLSHSADSLVGSTLNFNGIIDWTNLLVWPSIAPGGSTWSFTNGAPNTFTGGKVDVFERDAWV